MYGCFAGYYMPHKMGEAGRGVRRSDRGRTSKGRSSYYIGHERAPARSATNVVPSWSLHYLHPLLARQENRCGKEHRSKNKQEGPPEPEEDHRQQDNDRSPAVGGGVHFRKAESAQVHSV